MHFSPLDVFNQLCPFYMYVVCVASFRRPYPLSLIHVVCVVSFTTRAQFLCHHCFELLSFTFHAIHALCVTIPHSHSHTLSPSNPYSVLPLFSQPPPVLFIHAVCTAFIDGPASLLPVAQLLCPPNQPVKPRRSATHDVCSTYMYTDAWCACLILCLHSHSCMYKTSYRSLECACVGRVERPQMVYAKDNTNVIHQIKFRCYRYPWAHPLWFVEWSSTLWPMHLWPGLAKKNSYFNGQVIGSRRQIPLARNVEKHHWFWGARALGSWPSVQIAGRLQEKRPGRHWQTSPTCCTDRAHCEKPHTSKLVSISQIWMSLL